MTLDEAIKHAIEIAESVCGECAEEHRQLAEWLIELRDMKEKYRWHDLRKYPNDLPKDDGEYKEYLVCRKIPDCNVGECERYEECDIFDESCKHFFYQYDVQSLGEDHTDGYEIAWREIEPFGGIAYEANRQV